MNLYDFVQVTFLSSMNLTMIMENESKEDHLKPNSFIECVGHLLLIQFQVFLCNLVSFPFIRHFFVDGTLTSVAVFSVTRLFTLQDIWCGLSFASDSGSVSPWCIRQFVSPVFLYLLTIFSRIADRVLLNPLPIHSWSMVS